MALKYFILMMFLMPLVGFSEDFCPQKTEGTAIEKYKKYVKKTFREIKKSGPDGKLQAKTLSLLLQSNQVINLTDNLEDDYSKYKQHCFINYYQDKGYYLIGLQFEEGGGFSLINDKTGVETFLDVVDPPVFSPDSKRFFSASLDLDAEYFLNGIWVYGVQREALKLEFDGNTKNISIKEVPKNKRWSVSDAKWSGNEMINFSKVALDESGKLKILVNSCLKFTANKWHLLDGDACK